MNEAYEYDATRYWSGLAILKRLSKPTTRARERGSRRHPRGIPRAPD